jgi:hypothetical protein
MRDHLADQMPWGYFQLFHASAQAIRGRDPLFAETFPTAGGIDNWFSRLWSPDKQIRIDDDSRDLSCVHLWHGPFAEAWHGSRANGCTWELIGQTHPITGRLWTRRDLDLPRDGMLVRLDTAEQIKCELSDELITRLVSECVPFDVYAKGVK